jgi:glycosyltransferase involved in cell wall biosynthesis
MINPLVSIVLITYNHEQFIAKAIDSVLMQNVDFEYEIIIGEDLGPDNTRSICEQYASQHSFIRVLPREKNLGVVANWIDCVKQARGKYIMMLDGDDYWANPLKMQLQVEFMEAHNDCVISHTDVQVLHMSTNLLSNSKKHNVPEGMIQQDVLAGREQITSSSMCLRTEALLKHVPFDVFINQDFPCEDWPTIAILSAFGEIRYLPISTTVYRVGQPSITNEVNYDKIRRYWQRCKHMTECIYALFPDLGEFKDAEYYERYVYNALLNAAYENNDYASAREFAKKNPYKRRLATICARFRSTFIFYRIYRLVKK